MCEACHKSMKEVNDRMSEYNFIHKPMMESQNNSGSTVRFQRYDSLPKPITPQYNEFYTSRAYVAMHDLMINYPNKPTKENEVNKELKDAYVIYYQVSTDPSGTWREKTVVVRDQRTGGYNISHDLNDVDKFVRDNMPGVSVYRVCKIVDIRCNTSRSLVGNEEDGE